MDIARRATAVIRCGCPDAERERLEGELAGEREARQQAVGEALALKAIT